MDDEFYTLGTVIGTNSNNKTSQIARLTYKHSKLLKSDNEEETLLKKAYAEINDLADKLDLPDHLKNTAKEILRLYLNKKRGDPKLKIMKKYEFLVAVVFYACKHEFGGRTIKNISEQTEVEPKKIKRYYKQLIRERYLSIELNGGDPPQKIRREVTNLVEVFISRLNLENPKPIIRAACKIGENSLHFLEGKKPSSIAAASIFFILTFMGISCKQQELADIAGISPNTLRSVYKELYENTNKLPPLPPASITAITPE